MFLWMLIGVTVLTIPLFGGQLTNLARIRLRAVWAVAFAVAIQLVIITIFPRGDTPAHAVAHVVSYGIAAIFVVANRHLLGMWLAAFGAALNLLVIGVNGGVMPARAEALESTGVPLGPNDFENSRVVADAKLAFLGDIFAWPRPMPFPNVFSVGDIILILGVGMILHWVCGSRLIPRKLQERYRPPLERDETEKPRISRADG
jgi:hypothetical protein